MIKKKKKKTKKERELATKKTREWQTNNLQKYNEYNLRWRASNPEKAKEIAARHYKKNRKKYQEKRRKKYLENQEAEIKKARHRRAKNPNIGRASKLKKSYGITLKQYEDLLNDQKRKCAICLTKKPGGRGRHFHIDHDHETGKMRGLLCHSCNTGIGLLGDSLSGVLAAADYLMRQLNE